MINYRDIQMIEINVKLSFPRPEKAHSNIIKNAALFDDLSFDEFIVKLLYNRLIDYDPLVKIIKNEKP